MNERLDGKVAIVTGSGRGIGNVYQTFNKKQGLLRRMKNG